MPSVLGLVETFPEIYRRAFKIQSRVQTLALSKGYKVGCHIRLGVGRRGNSRRPQRLWEPRLEVDSDASLDEHHSPVGRTAVDVSGADFEHPFQLWAQIPVERSHEHR